MKLKWGAACLALMVLAACSSAPVQKFACDAEKTLSEKGAEKITQLLECEAPEAVFADVSAFVHRFGPCKQQTGVQMGGIGTVVCDLIVDAAVDKFGDKPLPVTWKCKATAAKQFIKTGLEAACALLPVDSEDRRFTPVCRRNRLPAFPLRC